MRHSYFLLAAACFSLLTATVACGDPDSGENGSSSGEATSSSGGSSGAVSQSDGGSSSGAAVGTLTVVAAGTSYPLVLADLPTTTFKEATVVALPTIWEATGLSSPYASYVFDFVGADGFRPSSRSNCADVVFDGATFAKGYVEVESQRLTWDDDLGFSGCAFVSDLATIEASDP